MMADVSVKVPRNPKCARCRNHGFVVQLKGHSGKCQFFSCKCWKCSLITDRTKIMASQRRLKKSQRDDIAINESLAVLATPASTAALDEDTLPHVPSNANLKSESVIRMPAGGTQTDGKTYMELEVAACAVKEHLVRPPTGGTIDVGMGAGRSSCPGYGVQDVFTMNRNTGDQMVTERVQKNVYMGERMTFPFHVYSYPNGYACPAIVVNLQPPVSFDPFSFPHPQSGGLSYAGDPVLPQDGRMPLFNPYSMPCPGRLEEVPVRHHLYFPQHMERESGGGRLLSRAELDSNRESEKRLGSQGSDILSVDNDSSQDTV